MASLLRKLGSKANIQQEYKHEFDNLQNIIPSDLSPSKDTNDNYGNIQLFESNSNAGGKKGTISKVSSAGSLAAMMMIGKKTPSYTNMKALLANSEAKDTCSEKENPIYESKSSSFTLGRGKIAASNNSASSVSTGGLQSRPIDSRFISERAHQTSALSGNKAISNSLLQRHGRSTNLKVKTSIDAEAKPSKTNQSDSKDSQVETISFSQPAESKSPGSNRYENSHFDYYYEQSQENNQSEQLAERNGEDELLDGFYYDPYTGESYDEYGAAYVETEEVENYEENDQVGLEQQPNHQQHQDDASVYAIGHEYIDPSAVKISSPKHPNKSPNNKPITEEEGPINEEEEFINMFFSKVRHNHFEYLQRLLELPSSFTSDYANVEYYLSKLAFLRDSYGNTVFHICAQNNHRRLAKVLLKYELNYGREKAAMKDIVNQRNHKRLTPLDYTNKYGFEKMSDWLVECGGVESAASFR